MAATSRSCLLRRLSELRRRRNCKTRARSISGLTRDSSSWAAASHRNQASPRFACASRLSPSVGEARKIVAMAVLSRLYAVTGVSAVAVATDAAPVIRLIDPDAVAGTSTQQHTLGGDLRRESARPYRRQAGTACQASRPVAAVCRPCRERQPQIGPLAKSAHRPRGTEYIRICDQLGDRRHVHRRQQCRSGHGKRDAGMTQMSVASVSISVRAAPISLLDPTTKRTS